MPAGATPETPELFGALANGFDAHSPSQVPMVGVLIVEVVAVAVLTALVLGVTSVRNKTTLGPVAHWSGLCRCRGHHHAAEQRFAEPGPRHLGGVPGRILGRRPAVAVLAGPAVWCRPGRSHLPLLRPGRGCRRIDGRRRDLLEVAVAAASVRLADGAVTSRCREAACRTGSGVERQRRAGTREVPRDVERCTGLLRRHQEVTSLLRPQRPCRFLCGARREGHVGVNGGPLPRSSNVGALL